MSRRLRHVVIAAVVLGGIVFALAIARGPRGAAPAAACIDCAARDQIDELRRAIAATAARPARANNPLAASAAAAADAHPAPLSEQGPRRYAHLEVSSPAVRVSQNDDGTYDVRTSDPALAESLVRVVAVTGSGEQDELIVRVPPR